jgi:hypothetical protein
MKKTYITLSLVILAVVSFSQSVTHGFNSGALLPVSFTGFYLSKSGQNIELSWSIDREVDNSHFEVERSYNGSAWEKIAVVFGAESTNYKNDYKYTDKNASSPVVYYRLRRVNIDGNAIYSSIRSIRQGEIISPVKIYGYQKNVVVDLNIAEKTDLLVSVFNTSGEAIDRKLYINPSYKINMQLPHVSPGTYIVQVSDKKGWSQVKKIIL